MNFSISSDLQYRKIHLKASLSYVNQEIAFIGVNTEAIYLTEVVESISPKLLESIDSLKLKSVLNIHCERFMLALKKKECFFLMKTTDALIGLKSSDKGSIFYLNYNMKTAIGNEKVDDAIKTMGKLVKFENFTLLYQSKVNNSLDNSFLKSLIAVNRKLTNEKDDEGFKATNVSLPKELSHYNFYLFTRATFDKETIFGRILNSKIEGELTLALGFSSHEAAAVVSFSMDLNDHANLKAYIYGNTKLELFLRGELTFNYHQEAETDEDEDREEIYKFTVDSKISPSEFLISGSMDEGYINYKFLTINNLGIAIGYSITDQLPIIGIKGNLTFDTEKEFHAFIAIYFGGHKSMLSGAISSIGIIDFVKLFTDCEVNEALDILRLEAFSLNETSPAIIEDSYLIKRNYKILGKIFKEYGIDLPEVNQEDTTTLQLKQDYNNDTLWHLTDNENMRHYTIEDGILRMDPQFYFATDKIHVWGRELQQGIFVACELKFLGLHFKNYIEIIHGKGIRILESMDKIDWGFLKISRSEEEKNIQEKIMAPSIVTSMMGSGTGPLFYLCTFKGKEALFLSGRLEIGSIILVDTLIIYNNRSIMIDIKTSLLNIKAHLSILASYNSFVSKQFKLKFELDFTKFNESFQRVSKEVSSYFGKQADKFKELQSKLKIVEVDILNLNRQVQDKKNSIAKVKKQIHNTSWRKAYKLPYYWGQIAVFESAVLGLEALMAVALKTLDLAKKALAVLEKESRNIGDIIDKLATIVDWFLHINYLRLFIEVDKVMDFAFEVDIDFQFLGRGYKRRYQCQLDHKDLFKSLSGKLEEKLKGTLKDPTKEENSLKVCLDTKEKIIGKINLTNYTDLTMTNKDKTVTVNNFLSLIGESNQKFIELYEYEDPEFAKSLNTLDKGFFQLRTNTARINEYGGQLKLVEALNDIIDIKKQTLRNDLSNDHSLSMEIDSLEGLVKDAEGVETFAKTFNMGFTNNDNPADETDFIRKNNNEKLKKVENLKFNKQNLNSSNLEIEAIRMVEHVNQGYGEIFGEEDPEGILVEFTGDTMVEKNDRQQAKRFYEESLQLYKKDLLREKKNLKESSMDETDKAIHWKNMRIYAKAIKRVMRKVNNL